VENANLFLAVASEPLFGIGFGSRFSIVYPLPDISRFYAEFDLVPHNSLLFLWAFAGPFGLACFGAFVATVVAAAIRLARSATDPRVIGLACIAGMVVVKSMAYVYADLGLREVRLLAEIGALSGCIFALSRSGQAEPKVFGRHV
jgi:O-antigen ligase